MPIQYSDVKWWQFVTPGNTFMLGENSRLRIEREIIPIIFVPGIMGSRLKNQEGKIAWDPDDASFMLENYGSRSSTPKKRKKMLIGEQFDPNYLEVSNDDSAHNEPSFYLSEDLKMYDIYDPGPDRAERGWGGIFWGSYGKFLLALETHRWKDPVGTCFDFPVHAFGYNWTDSNYNSGRKLNDYITDTIQKYKKYQGQERICNHVILVTHSMGGLVARSACKLHGAESNVLGVIHGVQPATGAAAAYWRMKAGFERHGLKGTVMSWILGTNGEEVTCILGNSPGGLELLPNKHYRDNGGNEAWLHVPLQNGTTISFPQSGDPYNEIYRKQEDVFWRMVNPAWLEPSGVYGSSSNVGGRMEADSPWGKYLECLNQAEDFHSNLSSECHKPTYQFYSTGLDTVDRIEFTREALVISNESVNDEFGNVYEYTVPSKRSDYRGEYKVYVDINEKEVWDFNAASYVLRMGMPKDCGRGGDGTVPESSAKHLSAKDGAELQGVDHQDFYQNGKAREYILDAVWNLAQARITEGIQNQA